MQLVSSTKKILRGAAAFFTALVLGTAFTPLANAGCANFQPSGKLVSWQTPGEFYRGLSVVRVADSAGVSPRAGLDDIVGMWRFTMSISGPNGQSIVIDDGYTQWHSDGTEIMNSGSHAPNTSNFCLGVWAPTGRGTYKLNHFPLAWDTSGAAPQGPVRIVANVKLTDHDHFSGPFTLDVYLWDGSEIVNASGPPIAHLAGTYSATRVTTETVVPGAP